MQKYKGCVSKIFLLIPEGEINGSFKRKTTLDKRFQEWLNFC